MRRVIETALEAGHGFSAVNLLEVPRRIKAELLLHDVIKLKCFPLNLTELSENIYLYVHRIND
jgi:hypothetical protein